MLTKQVQIYKQLFSKSFFFDKFNFVNIFQYPKIKSIKIQFTVFPQLGINKFKFCTLILFFYLITGQRPHFLMKNCNIKNTQRTKVAGLELNLHQYVYFFDFLIRRQLSLMTSVFQSFLLINNIFIFEVIQKIQDDDILFQALQVPDSLKYQICLKSNSSLQSHLQSLLINLKIPLKNASPTK
jgi:hypothetical protein